MDRTKTGVLVAVFTFSAATQAAFDQLDAFRYGDEGGTTNFIGDELSLSQFVSLDFQVGSEMPPVSAPEEEVSDPVVSLVASPVPVPSAVWFFSSALVALTVIQRRA